MHHPPAPLRRALTWAEVWPSVRAALVVIVLFAAAMWLARIYAVAAQDVLSAHPRLGPAILFASSAWAVLMPAMTNLPLLPFAVLAWGPWTSAALLLCGWVLGAGLSFAIGRHASAWVLRRFPAASRYADIDRLIHPRHRMLSLVMLRMTFPVDVLSYALGLFSRRTTLGECLLSTVLGAAPFALLFALLPTLSTTAQSLTVAASLLAFAGYAWWILRRALTHPSALPPDGLPTRAARSTGTSRSYDGKVWSLARNPP
jgi:uncharacterized membrane protein YdjX (TVP38/TMEM64 family)